MEKHRVIQSQIHSVIINQDEITDQDEKDKQIFSFCQLTTEQTLNCEAIIFEDEVFKGLKSIENNKSPGNDGLSKEIY